MTDAVRKIEPPRRRAPQLSIARPALGRTLTSWPSLAWADQQREVGDD
jgi:hypothetical protein